jgi:gliding motility-associated-like protein
MLYDFCKINSNTVSIQEYCPPVVYVPTAFSPNGDGLNDNLRIWGKRFVNLTVEIYSQWGTVMFAKNIASENESVIWDSVSTNGVAIPSGIYVVQTSYFDARTSRPISERHVVSVIR